MKGHHIGGIDERKVQILGHEAGGEILAAAHQLLGCVTAAAGALGEGGELLANGIGEPQLVGDVEIALADIGEQVPA